MHTPSDFLFSYTRTKLSLNENIVIYLRSLALFFFHPVYHKFSRVNYFFTTVYLINRVPTSHFWFVSIQVFVPVAFRLFFTFCVWMYFFCFTSYIWTFKYARSHMCVFLEYSVGQKGYQ